MSFTSKIKQLLCLAASTTSAEKAAAPEIPAVEQVFQGQLRQQIALRFTDLAIKTDEKTLSFYKGELALENDVFERTEHPSAVVYGLRLCLIHKRFFPTGIVDCLAGIGSTDAEAMEAGARNYVGSVFSVVMEALAGGYEPASDFKTENGALWHTVIGPLHLQGIWTRRSAELDDTLFLRALKPFLLPNFELRPFHWLKLYISRQPSGELIGDCFFDNASWAGGVEMLKELAAQWPEPGAFAGQKQFIMFRNCPATGLTEKCAHPIRADADDADGHLELLF